MPRQPLNRTRRALVATASAGAALLALPAFAQPQPAASASPATPAGFDDWAERFAADWVRQSAERATATQYFSGDEQAALDRQLTPQTPDRRARQRALARDGLAQLAAFEAGAGAGGLSPTQRVDAAVLRWSLQRTVAGEPFEDHSFVFNQMNGPHVGLLSLLAETQPLRRPADLAAYQQRLQQVAPRLDEAIARARSAAARGLLPPRFILDRARAQVQAFLAPAPENTDLLLALARRTERMDGLAPDERQRALDAAARTVADAVRPAYQRVLALLDEMAPATNNDAGLWRLPNGAQAYAQALAGNTTTSLGAEEIHAIGLREVARIEAEMDRVLRSTNGGNRKDGTVQARMNALRAELQPPAEPDPRPMLLSRYADMVRDNERRAQALFNLQPRAPVDVRRVPALTERTASAYYTSPAPDGSRPGVFWVPLPGPAFDMPKMRSLTVHEAVPGHHFQIALQQEQNNLPRWRQRRVFGGGSAHSEGWALYAERLAIDNGWYDGDAISLLGALDAQLFRARRLVVDTGLHAKRWTRQQAIDYGISAQEVERYVANPGQACAYMIGMLRILDLRDQCRSALGSRFKIKEFHDVVLKTGSVPLDVLGEVLQRWTVERKAAAV